MKLPVGLYESLLSHEYADAILKLETLAATEGQLTSENAPSVLSHHLNQLLLKAFKNVRGEDKLASQLQLANKLVEILTTETPEAGIDEGDGIDDPARMLLSIKDPREDRLGTGELERPSLPLRQSDLIVNGPRDLRMGNELRKELASADRLDFLVAFLKWSGLRVIKRELTEFCRRNPGCLRILTTTYMGATEVEALDALKEMGADIRVSYDNRRTRVHAKAWLFHRRSGFSTAMVGSSNLSRSALLDGCEWNVRLSAVDNATVLSKFQATFDQYWDDSSFEVYDRERFLKDTSQSNRQLDAVIMALQLRPYPHQQVVLDALEEERKAGHTRNLVVAATGTGKTVVAALDYLRLRKSMGEARLLFVAHRKEILEQSQAVFRAAVQDGGFGELLVGPHKPIHGQHVFASIQSLHKDRLAALDPVSYDVLIVDEFHHAEAPTYQQLLNHLKPKILLGLTATPERTDGQSILGWFDDRVASEMRLWDAIDQDLLAPFQYFGVHDGTDLSAINWRSGRYDVSSLEKIYTADDYRASLVLRAINERIRAPHAMRALGFCVSIAHANFMTAFCCNHGLDALAVTSKTPTHERGEAIRRLSRGEVNVLFTVDLFNEGVDIKSVDTVLFLRPTESATVFLQQLGRGLRLSDDKDCLTVLDFIGTANRKFRFDMRYRAVIGGTRAGVRRAVEQGFPHLPSGCELQLDRESQAEVLRNLRAALPSDLRGLEEDLRTIGDVSLREFLRSSELELEDLYRNNRCLTWLKHRVGFLEGQLPQSPVINAMTRMLHVDDPLRLDTWRRWLSQPAPPAADISDPLLLMFFAALGFGQQALKTMSQSLSELWEMKDLQRELLELLEELADRRRRPTWPLEGLPFQVHATYGRDEISAGLSQERKGKLLRTQSGVLKDTKNKADVLYVTLQKNEKEFTPTTLYNDYPISLNRFHWESQSATRADSETGRRYQGQSPSGWRTLLFVREAKRDDRGVTMPYLFLGPVRYLHHKGEKPMQITWALERAMPQEFFRQVKVAAG